MNNIVIEMEKLSDLYCGLGQVCLHLGNNILKQPANFNSNFDLEFLVPKDKVGVFGSDVKYHISHKLYRQFPFLAPKAALWHSIHQDTRFFPPRKNIPFIITVNDLNFLFEGKSIKDIKRCLKELQKRVDRATHLVAISKFTKEVTLNHLRLGNTPIEVIYQGVELTKSDVLTEPPAYVPKGNIQYLFTMGTILPKKNFIVLIDMLKRIPDLHLIIAGSTFGNYTDKIIRRAKKLNVLDRLIIPGTVSEEEKTWLYENCMGFVFPSIAEGFGIPPIEAMRLGKPVFLSKETSLPEIGGPHAYYFQSFDPDHMAEVFEKGLSDFTREKSQEVTNWSRKFSWSETSKQYLDLYQRILSQL